MLYYLYMEQQALANNGMTCPICKSASKRFGHHRNGLRRFRCLSCRKTFTESHERTFRVEDYLNEDRGIMAIQLLVEGCSIRTVERITGIRGDSDDVDQSFRSHADQIGAKRRRALSV
jgi:transposase-like protein